MKSNSKKKPSKELPRLPVSDFKTLFESIPGLYLILNWDLTIFAASDAYLRATMTTREEIVGRYIFDVFPDNPADQANKGSYSLFASFEKVLKTGLADAMPQQRYDIRRPKSEGGGFEERYWNPINSACSDEKGNVTYIIHHVEDVTELVKLNRQREEQLKENEILRVQNKQSAAEAFAKLQESETRLKSLVDTILDTIIDGVVTFNRAGKIQSFNKACETIFGYKAEEAHGKDANILVPESSYKELTDSWFGNRDDAVSISDAVREISGKRKDNSVFPMEWAVGQIKQGEAHAYVGIVRDISERKETEKVHDQLRHIQKLESLGQLTGGIAHDFNNLLAVIMGNLDFLIERTQHNDPLREFIKPSIEAAEHGAELTKQLLAFSRKQALQPKTIIVNELLHYFAALVRHTLGERIEVILALENNLWNIHVDPSQLQNALLNLAVNARDAMPQGGKLIFETHNTALDEEYAENDVDVVPGDYVVIAVSDTGEGMTPHIIEKAFEPFFTTKEVGKGSGLGLSMVYGFVKQSKGHIKLYSERGQGTSIKIYLPRADGVAVKEEPIKVKPVAHTKKTQIILVVEDNKNVLKLTSSMVESLGYTVIQAETGDAAVTVLKEHPEIDLLLTDVMLPGVLNGPELAKRAIEIYPRLKVLFNSGYAEQSILQSGLLEEGVNLIGKPFRKQQLAAKLEEIFDKDTLN